MARTIDECIEQAEVLSPDPQTPPSAQTPQNGVHAAQPPDLDGAAIVDGINQSHAVVLYGSRPLVLRENPGAPVADRLKLMSFDAFRDLYSNKNHVVTWIERNPITGQEKQKTQLINTAQYWLRNPERRQYEGIEFFPHPAGAEGTAGYYNLWRGFSVRADTTTAPADRMLKYKTFHDHLRVNVAAGCATAFTWIWAWLAHLIQKPRERIGTALVLRGSMGAGKSIVGEVIGSLFEDHYFQVDNARYLTGQFNGHMAGCLLLQVDEGVWAGDKGAEGRLKGVITSTVQMVEVKGLDPIRLKNHVCVIITSNEGWVVPAGPEERRFAVFDVANHAKQNHAYFREMLDELDDGGREALLADLLAYDLNAPGAPNLRSIPKTTALLEQKVRSFDPVEAWWFGRLNEGTTTKRGTRWHRCVPVATLYGDYLTTSDHVGVRRKADETTFGIALHKLVPGIQKRRVTVVEDPDGHGGEAVIGKRTHCYVLPSLAECRAAAAARLGQNPHWDAPAADDDAEEEEAEEG